MEKEYIVVRSTDCEVLEDKVDELVKKGYGVFGPLQILDYRDEIAYIQVLLKLHKQPSSGPIFVVDPNKIKRG